MNIKKTIFDTVYHFLVPCTLAISLATFAWEAIHGDMQIMYTVFAVITGITIFLYIVVPLVRSILKHF